MGTISENFSYSEFEQSNYANDHHITNVINTVEVRDSIKSLVIEVLQPLRNSWKKGMHIDSGYRCPEVNKGVGGVPSSQHTKGEAADIGSDTPMQLAQLASDLKLPFDQMIIYPTFVHFSHKLSGVQRGQVLYNYRYKGPKIIER